MTPESMISIIEEVIKTNKAVLKDNPRYAKKNAMDLCVKRFNNRYDYNTIEPFVSHFIDTLLKE